LTRLSTSAEGPSLDLSATKVCGTARSPRPAGKGPARCLRRRESVPDDFVKLAEFVRAVRATLAPFGRVGHAQGLAIPRPDPLGNQAIRLVAEVGSWGILELRVIQVVRPAKKINKRVGWPAVPPGGGSRRDKKKAAIIRETNCIGTRPNGAIWDWMFYSSSWTGIFLGGASCRLRDPGPVCFATGAAGPNPFLRQASPD